MEHLGPQRVVFVGGSHNGILRVGQIDRLGENPENKGFSRIDSLRSSI